LFDEANVPLLLGIVFAYHSIQQTSAPEGLPHVPEGKMWNLTWHDEFEGTALDQSKWVYRPDGQRRDGSSQFCH
jgi:hypothetical protein